MYWNFVEIDGVIKNRSLLPLQLPLFLGIPITIFIWYLHTYIFLRAACCGETIPWWIQHRAGTFRLVTSLASETGNGPIVGGEKSCLLLFTDLGNNYRNGNCIIYRSLCCNASRNWSFKKPLHVKAQSLVLAHPLPCFPSFFMKSNTALSLRDRERYTEDEEQFHEIEAPVLCTKLLS
jgi:hypothetical protein